MSKGFLLSKSIYIFRFLFFVFLYFFTYSFSFADGGTVTYTDSSGLNPRSSPSYAGGYTVHTFTATGTTNFTIPLNVTSIDYLVVGGGGGGGVGTGGGGGAGGMLTGNGTTTFYSGYTYTVTVGNGGPGAEGSPNWYGINGSSSVFGSFIIALGGGGGGGNDGAEAGRNGGSGGGAGGPPGGSSPGSGTAGQGYSGGSYGSIQGGGGGGAGEAGSTDSSGYGGDGLQSSISGTATWYAGGGGGRNTGGSSGGTGGGGGESQNGTNGTGGGGGGYHPTRGDGGSGIVIVRYLTPDPNLAVLATSTSVSYVTESSATFSSSLISIGGASVTSRGICYGTTRYPTNCVAEGGTAIGDFSITLSNLATSTTYFYRSYATNSYGTSTSADGIFTTEGITNSLMFDSGSSQYLSRTFSTATDGKKWTYSFWVKRSMLYAQNNIQFVLATAGSGAQGFIGFGQANNSDEISFGYSGYVRRYTNMQFRDPSAWQHVVLRVDTATSSEADRAIFYVNGVQVSMVTPTTISQNDTTQINQAVSTLIGNQTGQAYGRFDGYLSDTNFIDGQALAPDYFGRPDPNTGNWVPKAYQGTYGVNGFHLNFSSSTALGYDTAPLDSIHTATNTWTTNGGMSSTTNQVIDTPLNNFATFSSNNSRYYNGTIPVYRGGLRVADSSDYCTAASSFGMTTGKWYYEIKLTSDGGSGYGRIGIQNTQNRTLPSYPDYDTKSYVYTTGGNKILDGTSTSYGNTFTSNDLIGVAFDADNSTLTFYKNGLSQGTINNIPVGTYIPIVGDIANATNFIWDANFGQRPFTYTPPTGFKALSTANLPTPTILKPNQHFDAKIYTGNGATQVISGLNFQPDFVWVKNRTSATSNRIVDSTRGAAKSIQSDVSGISNPMEQTETTGLTSFISNGFEIGADADYNTSSNNFISWNWKESTTAGLDVVMWTGNNGAWGNSRTVSHSLSSVPEFIIAKNLDKTDQWIVYHHLLTGGANAASVSLHFNENIATYTNSSYKDWVGTMPTDTQFSVDGNILNNNNQRVIAYAFSEVPGYSKFGSYTGNGSSDGSFVYTGFKPRYIMIKRTDSANEWTIIDTARNTYNPLTTQLYANQSTADTTWSSIDSVSNGFKIRSANGESNASGGTYIYVAFAESVMVPTVPSLPTLSSPTATSTTEVTAVLGGTVDTLGSTDITARGVCYGSTPAPTTNCTAGTGTSIGVFTVSITGLATSTTYYYRAYATNASGTAYSSDSTFTTEGLTNSLMFDSASSQYLSRNPSVTGNQQKWTWSGWVKRGKLGTGVDIFSAKLTGGSYPNTAIVFDTTDAIRIWSYTGGSFKINKYTSAVFRDPSAWIHISVAVDSTDATAEDRVRIYVNGTRLTSFSTNTNPSQNDTFDVNVSGNNHVLGGYAAGSYGYFDGYMSDVNFIDGQALDPTYFGKADSNTGNWIPKSYTGTYGTNGFRLNFNNSNQLGFDSSGNSNHWGLNGGITQANNQVIDTPLNNFTILTPLMKGSNVTLASGNLKQTGANSASAYQTSFAPFVMKTGKWYWEATQQNAYWGYIGSIIEYSRITSSSDFPGYYSDGYTVDSYDGKTWNNNSTSATYSAMPTGGTRMIAYDADTGKLWIGQNGTWFNSGLPANGTGEVFSNIPAGDKVPTFMVYAGTGAVNVNFGQGGQSGLTYYSGAGGKFKYEPPTGFKALSTANLPIPSILKPNQHFDVVTYTGNGTSQIIQGLNFQPDFVWMKRRSSGSYNNIINDVVRGPNKTLFSNSSNYEYTDRGVTSFNTDGFSLSGTGEGDINTDTQPYVAWSWKAGNATTTNTVGSITSTVSANPTAGLSIISYTGNGISNATVGHGLNATPTMIIVKDRDSNANNNEWHIYHKDTGGGYYLSFEDNARALISGTSYGSVGTSPSPTTFTLASGSTNSDTTNESGDRYVAYVFSEVPGYSKFGSYTGNANTDGPFIYTGFKPRWIMVKRADTTGDWQIIDTKRDPYNVNYNPLFPNITQGESPDHAYDRDILSNGFKIRTSHTAMNTSGGTFIYAAFAESIMIPIVASSTSSSSSTITPPSDVTVTPGNGQATIDYTISPTSNFTEILVLRSNQDITDVPTDGVDYSVGNAIGSASVGCVDSTISTSTENVFDSCVATGLSNSTLYYFKVYSKDASGNYSLIQSVEGASTTPSVGATAVTVTSYRLRKDDGGEVTANYSHSENTPMNTGFISGDKRRIRFVVSNQTASLTKKRYQLEYAVTPCSSWTVLPKANEATNQHFRMDLSPFVPDNSTTTRSNGVTAPNGKTFVPGRIQTFNNLTYPIVLRENQFTEVEYSVRATNNVALNTSYCFRATGYGDAADFTYTNTPQISSLSTAYRYQGGGTGGSQLSSVSILKIEDPTVVATTSQTGGDQGGTAVSTSTTVEATSTPASQQSTTTPTRKRGGGGATGYEPPKNNYAYSAVKDSLTFMNLFIKELANYQLKSTAINAYAYQECNLKGLIFIKTGECEHLDMYGDNKSKLNLNILWSVFNKIEEIGK